MKPPGDVSLLTPSGHVNTSTLKGVRRGKSAAFRGNPDQNLCFSIITDDRTVDLQAENLNAFKDWIIAFEYLCQMHKVR